MITEDLQRSITEVRKTFSSGTLESEVCSYVLRRLDELEGGRAHLTLSSVATNLGWTNDIKKKQAISKALDFLTTQRVAILERRFELWASANSNEVLEEPICELTNDDIRPALEGEILINPITGEAVPDFLDRVTIVYVVTDFVKNSTGKDHSI